MKLSVILVSYNTKEFLKGALKSLRQALKKGEVNQKSSEIIVVDNGSTDGSVEMVKNEFPKVKLIANKKNLGFAGGNNVGIGEAQGDYVMLLNTDTLIKDEEVLDKLVEYLDEHQNVGVISPQLVLPDGAIDLACHRGFPTPWNALAYFGKLEQFLPNNRIFGGYHQTWKDFDKIHEVDAVAGAAMMVRREVIDEVGLMDDRFPMYAEDIDWCKRIKDAGWKVVYNPESEILHLKGQAGKAKKKGSSEHQFATKSFYSTMKQFYEKHYADQYPGWLRKLVFLGINLLEKLK